MDTLEHGSRSVAPLGSPVHWHFRALPREAQREAIRRLALSGLNEDQIAASTGLSVDSVRRAISEDDCLRHFPVPTGAQSPWSQFAPRGAPAN
jgi:hypothetical protein